jgi:hypothetical protein
VLPATGRTQRGEGHRLMDDDVAALARAILCAEKTCEETCRDANTIVRFAARSSASTSPARAEPRACRRGPPRARVGGVAGSCHRVASSTERYVSSISRASGGKSSSVRRRSGRNDAAMAHELVERRARVCLVDAACGRNLSAGVSAEAGD